MAPGSCHFDERSVEKSLPRRAEDFLLPIVKAGRPVFELHAWMVEKDILP